MACSTVFCRRCCSHPGITWEACTASMPPQYILATQHAKHGSHWCKIAKHLEVSWMHMRWGCLSVGKACAAVGKASVLELGGEVHMCSYSMVQQHPKNCHGPMAADCFLLRPSWAILCLQGRPDNAVKVRRGPYEGVGNSQLGAGEPALGEASIP